MSRVVGKHERRGARMARASLPRGTARSHEPLPGEHVPEKSDSSRSDRAGESAERKQGRARVQRGNVGQKYLEWERR